MFHYHYIKVIADSENMSTEEITSVLQKYFNSLSHCSQ